MSTVTVSKDLRLRLKRLAAKYDTTQAEIIKRSVDLFEQNASEAAFPSTKDGTSRGSQPRPDIEAALAEARANFEKRHPNVARVHAALREDPDLLDESTISDWPRPFEE